jgi:alpha-galactosidase
MTELLEFGNDAITVRMVVGDDQRVRIVAIGPTGHLTADVPLHNALNPVELHFSGDELPQGSRHVQHGGTAALRYAAHSVDDHRFTLEQLDADRGVVVSTTWRLFDGLAVVQATTTVTNTGGAVLTLEYVSSFVYNGFVDFADPTWASTATVAIPNSTFFGEFQWVEHTLPDLGIIDVGFSPNGLHSSKKRIAVTSVGTNPTAEYLPMGAVSNAASGITWAWQIDHNGSWHWELGDHLTNVYLAAGGPNEQEHQWRTVLAPGESFVTVPVAVTAVVGGLTEVFAPLTGYRRSIRRPNADNEHLPVVFNDYMNSLMAEPTADRLLPVITAAAAVGCEYYCVDAGWYSDEPGWWNSVGEWVESAARFPNGFVRVFDLIREAGMRPGLWIEPEVVGVESPLARDLPESAFFVRNGARVNAAGRYQLDFRSPAVIERMDAVVHRLVTDYGLAYLKFDYNVNGGIGTDFDADSAGDGLLGHNRALLAWIDGLFARYPDIVIEACASGGGRADYATLRRHSIVSTSDQTDHLLSIPIAASAPTAITPEQAAIWVYPQHEFGPDEFDLSIVNGLLARPQISGRVWKLSKAERERLAEAISVYKTYRTEIPAALPTWPLGLPRWDDEWVAHGLVSTTATYLSIWRRGGSESIRLPGIESGRVDVLFPRSSAATTEWREENLFVTLPAIPSAVLLRVTKV